MIERVIENWLISVTEREFQIPFCQVLALDGHQIIHVSTHGPFEQGKDIIAIDPRGHPCAYQLKVGDISLNRWRSEVRAEVEELLDVPINHPSVDKTVPHRSILVTTGNLSDPVRREIDDRNEARRREGKPVLETLTRGQVLNTFVEAHGSFLPAEVGDLHLFLELYNRPGRHPLPKDKLGKLLSIVLPISPNGEGGGPGPKQIERMAASALLLASYVLAPYERAENHWASAEGWLVTAFYVLAVVERFGCQAELMTTIRLLRDTVSRHLESLKEEALSCKRLYEGSMFDGVVYPYRITILHGYLCGYQLWRKLTSAPDWQDARVTEFYTTHSRHAKLFGESSIPHLVMTFWYLKASGANDMAGQLFENMIKLVADVCSQDDGGLLNPYYDIETAIRAATGLLKEPINESFERQSYALRTLLVLAARHGYRDVLASEWCRISRINCSEFFARPRWEFFLWRAAHGELISSFPEQTQSWAKLRADTLNFPQSDLPVILGQYPEFGLLMSLAYPHRFRSDLVAFLDERVMK